MLLLRLLLFHVHLLNRKFYSFLLFYLCFRLRLIVAFDSCGPIYLLDPACTSSRDILLQMNSGALPNCFKPISTELLCDSGLLYSEF